MNVLVEFYTIFLFVLGITKRHKLANISVLLLYVIINMDVANARRIWGCMSSCS